MHGSSLKVCVAWLATLSLLVYTVHTTAAGSPSAQYWDWAKEGWANQKAERFPMGRGAKPEFSLWDGERLGYIDARKRIYAPLYARAV
jgi:hypothetical protein